MSSPSSFPFLPKKPKRHIHRNTHNNQRREKSMEKRMLLGVRKERPIKPSKKKKKLLNRVFNYFTSDSHMFAPLVSRPTSAFTSSIKKSIRGGEIKTPIREKQKLLNNVCDYLKSNCYMYAPLLAPPQALIGSPRGSSLYVERVTATIEVSKKKVILKGYKPKEKSADGRLENQASKGSLPEEVVKQRSSVQKDTVKNMVHNSCRSSSMPGRGMLGSQIRKLIDR